ncbi:MAG: DJ-1/PfpI family protein [Candidatus Terrybacteria bacterium]|nr:DJ-1/PfpI family protein [Candidatus Terrybacteria bacterium]
MKKVVIIIAFRDFQDKEYFGVKEVLEKADIKIITAGAEKGVAIGVYGGEVDIEMNLKDININDYDAMVFIGGGGALKYLDNELSYKIIQETVKAGKVLAAICIAPVILAKAGALKGKRATVWSSQFDKGPIKILQESGAEYVDENAVADGNIVTANGPASANEFGEKIAGLISG